MPPLIHRAELFLELAQLTEEKSRSSVWNKVMPLGKFFRADFPKDGLDIAPEYVESMVRNWDADGRPELPVDYLHGGETADDGAPLERKVAAGWITSLEARADGLWAAIRWTDRARTFIRAEEFKRLSPTWSSNGTDPRTGKPRGPTLYSVALLNDPYFATLPRVAASDRSTHEAADEATGASKMDPKKLRAALGLPETATDEDVMKAAAAGADAAKAAEQAAAEAAKQKAEAEKLRATAGDADAKLRAAQVAVDTLSASNKDLSERVKKMEDEKQAQATDRLCAGLIKEGRITAAQQADVKAYASAMGLEKATEFFQKLPKVVPLGELGVTGTMDSTEGEAAKLAAAAEAIEKANPGMSGTAALRAAARAHPELTGHLVAADRGDQRSKN